MKRCESRRPDRPPRRKGAVLAGKALRLMLGTLSLAACGTNPYVGTSIARDAGGTAGTSTSGTPGTGGAGASGPDAQPADPGTAALTVTVASPRLLDLVVMIDNSPSMGVKVAKFSAAFPKLLSALVNPNDGTLPDLRVAILDSDLGTGMAYASGSCGPKTLADGTTSAYGDLGRFQMLNTPLACAVTPGAEFLEYKSGRALNYAGDLGAVFACLAGNLGTLGCGEEHSLQALEFGLVAKGIGNDTQQADFLRPAAKLGLVFLTDEDDCSAATMDGLFGDQPELHGESASLRCATRSHACGGANLTLAPPGYPTSSAFTHPFGDCQARMGDECSPETDTSRPTTCNPLRGIKLMADELKALKSDPDQVFVAGIFGWPQSDADLANAAYKIAPVPNPNTADTLHPTVYDYWPVCYDPNHPPSAGTTDPATGFDATAAGWGATGGLRAAAFVNQFGGNGMKFSICQPDFGATLTSIGSAMAGKLQSLCFPYQLRDGDATAVGLQPDCLVQWLTPVADPFDPTQVTWQTGPAPLPYCSAGVPPEDVPTDCWQLVTDSQRCPTNAREMQVVRTVAEIAASPQLPAGTKVQMSCRVCPTGSTDPGCAY
jgi:hypothetical protein